jgi:hypothetical protein
VCHRCTTGRFYRQAGARRIRRLKLALLRGAGPQGPANPSCSPAAAAAPSFPGCPPAPAQSPQQSMAWHGPHLAGGCVFHFQGIHANNTAVGLTNQAASARMSPSHRRTTTSRKP